MQRDNLNYRPAKNGFVNADLLDTSFQLIMGILKTYLRSADDFKYMTNPKSISDLLTHVKPIVGSNFKSFLIANYDNGIGVRSELVKTILHYFGGKVSARAVIARIKTDETMCVGRLRVNTDETPQLKQVRGFDDDTLKLLEDVQPLDFFRLIEAIGPVLLAKLFLTFNGEVHYVND